MRCSTVDLKHEAEFAERFQARFPSARLGKLNDYQKLDFAVLSVKTGSVGGFVEFKQRNCFFGDYVEYYLNLQKFISLGEVHATTGLPCWLALGFHDGDYMYKYSPDDRFPVGYVASQREAVVCLPPDRFFNLQAVREVAET